MLVLIGFVLINYWGVFPVADIIGKNFSQRPELLCATNAALIADKDGYAYGYHNCEPDYTAERCVCFIRYSSGPYLGRIFQMYYDDAGVGTQENAYIFIDGQKFYLHR